MSLMKEIKNKDNKVVVVLELDISRIKNYDDFMVEWRNEYEGMQQYVYDEVKKQQRKLRLIKPKPKEVKHI